MEDENFLTRLLMTVFGIMVWIFVVIAIISSVSEMVKKAKLEKEGKEVVAEVWSKSHDEKGYRYYVKYTIDGKEYRDNFKTKDNSIKEGEKVILYYLQGEEDKIYSSKENNVIKNIFKFVSYIIALSPIAYFGKVCIKNYNIFKYKRTIEVE